MTHIAQAPTDEVRPPRAARAAPAATGAAAPTRAPAAAAPRPAPVSPGAPATAPAGTPVATSEAPAPPKAANRPTEPPFRNATCGPTQLRRALRTGALIRVGRDTYLEPHPEHAPAWERTRAEMTARCATLQRRGGESFVSSHTTAGLIHGLWVPTSTTLHVTQPHSRVSTPHRDAPVVRHRRALEAREVTTVEGLRVTSLERTVIDCAALLPADWALAMADSAVRSVTQADRRFPDRARDEAAMLLDQWLHALEDRGPRPGRRRARAVLAAANPLSESPGESRTRAVLLAPGLPEPTLQILIQVGDVRYWADFGWLIEPGRYLLGEFDGAAKYRLGGLTGQVVARTLSREKRREDGIRRLGHDVERVVDADLTTARARAGLVQRIRAKLPAALLENCAPRPGLALIPPGR